MTANTQHAPTTDDTAQTPSPAPKVRKKFTLSDAFNMAAGAAAAFGAATTIKVAATTVAVAAPPVALAFAIAAAAGAVGGLASHSFVHWLNNRGDKKEAFDWKAARRSMLFGALGGGLFEWLFQGVSSALTAQAPIAPQINSPLVDLIPVPDMPGDVLPKEYPLNEALFRDDIDYVQDVADHFGGEADTAETIVEDTPPAPQSLTERLQDMAKDLNLSERAQQSLARLGSDNAAVAAQAKKDFAVFLTWGIDGAPKDAALGLELFREAAAEGNAQAIRDLAILEGRAPWPEAPAAQAPQIQPAPTPAPAAPSAIPAQADHLILHDGSVFYANPPAETVAPPAMEAPANTTQPGNCQAIVSSGDIEFVCTIPDTGLDVRVGDRIDVPLPASLRVLMPG